jgi:microcystin-dependent protein
MSKLLLTITKAGLDRFTAAQLDEDIDLSISSVGLTDADFVVAPTLTALPGKFRTVATISGQQVGDNVVHMTMRDDAEIGYIARGFGLFLADGTLFAVYGQSAPLFEKSPRATLLVAIDIGFPTGDVRELTFGDTSFVNPPATTQTKGVVRLASPALVAAGTSTTDAITPADLRRVMPIGTIMLWYGAGNAVPGGWAICDGRQVDRSDGAGKVQTPDLRDRVVVGAGGAHAVGDAFGAERQSTTAGGAHEHEVTVRGVTDAVRTGVTVTSTTKTDAAGGGSGTVLASLAVTDPPHSHSFAVTGQAASAEAHAHSVDVTQPSLALLYIMKV